jgi:hypothetical protein
MHTALFHRDSSIRRHGEMRRKNAYLFSIYAVFEKLPRSSYIFEGVKVHTSTEIDHIRRNLVKICSEADRLNWPQRATSLLGLPTIGNGTLVLKNPLQRAYGVWLNFAMIIVADPTSL